MGFTVVTLRLVFQGLFCQKEGRKGEKGERKGEREKKEKERGREKGERRERINSGSTFVSLAPMVQNLSSYSSV